MKNTLILNLTHAFTVEHIGTVDDGTDRVILEIRHTGAEAIRVYNTPHTLDYTVAGTVLRYELEKPYFIGRGNELLTITTTIDGTETEAAVVTIVKTPPCGGGYMVIQTDTFEFRMAKQQKADTAVYDASTEQVVGTWYDGKPIYRKLIMENYLLTAQAANVINIEALNIDKIVDCNAFTYTALTDAANWVAIGYPGNPAATDNQRIFIQTNSNKQNLYIYSYWAYYATAWLYYTKMNDVGKARNIPQASDGEFMDIWTLAWESDLAADNKIAFAEPMTGHKAIAFELRQAAPTSAGHSYIYSLPVAVFKEMFNYNASPRTWLALSTYDNHYAEVTYWNEYTVFFDFSTTSRLRRIWFID